MFDEPIITVVFRLLNFAALIGLFAFIYKRYFQREIEQDIERERLEEINLHETIKQLDARSKELAESVIDQENICKQLLARTTEWKEASEKALTKQRQDRQLLHHKTIERAQKQQNMIEYQKLVQTILPQVIKKTHHELTLKFAHPEKQKMFVFGILEMMEKSE